MLTYGPMAAQGRVSYYSVRKARWFRLKEQGRKLAAGGRFKVTVNGQTDEYSLDAG